MTYLTQAADDLLTYGGAMTLDAMREALTGIVEHHTAPLVGERDQARAIACQLEEQVAQAAALHPSVDLGNGSFTPVPWCRTCGVSWPCPTASALDVDGLSADAVVDLTEDEVPA